MILYPDVARKAQAEIDTIVGLDRLPSFADREKLPYINALVLEVIRWHSVTPTGNLLAPWFCPSNLKTESLGVPHRVTEDNIHEGYMIPKGTLIIPNIW